VQCIIKASGLYYSPSRQARINRKRSRTRSRRRITQLERKPVSGFLLCLDTVARHVARALQSLMHCDSYASENAAKYICLTRLLIFEREFERIKRRRERWRIARGCRANRQ